MTETTYDLVLDEPAYTPLGALIAFELKRGDWISLEGDLGAGKTTLARCIIRALLNDAEAEVPSPTFALAQGYETPRLNLTHFDFYRLSGADEAAETGIDEALSNGAVLVEWPERAAAIAPSDRLVVSLVEADAGAKRKLTFAGHGRWGPRITRLLSIRDFLIRAGWGDAGPRPLPGDASARRYMRVEQSGRSALLMDAPRQPDGPPIRAGKPYSRIAHLAEDVRPFVAVARHLEGLGLSAPKILAQDLDAGLLLLEDLGDRVYGAELAAGADQLALWRDAIEPLLVLRRAQSRLELSAGDGPKHVVPHYDAEAMQIEVELLLDWYVPALTGAPASADMRADFLARWKVLFDDVLAQPTSLVLRDYHSPNLIVLPDRHGARRTGLIDFQDALIGHPAYDLVSLLQDARLDVPEHIEREMLAEYIQRAAAAEPGFDAPAFERAFRILGSQRNTKILGIFVRLARRDGKPRYLAHIPRIWRYLERDLAHPALNSLRGWYDRHLEPALRQRPL